MSNTEPVNLSKLRSYVGDSDSDVKDMINLFLQIIPQQKEKLQKAIQERNWGNLNYTAHQIKPSLDILGLSEAKEKAKVIETLAKTGTEEKLMKQLVDELSQELEDVCNELTSSFNKEDDSNTMEPLSK